MEKRMYPRVNIDLPVVIFNQDGDRVVARVKDMSLGGLAVECNMAERNLLTPGGSYVREGRPVQLTLCFDLPGGDRDKMGFEVNCHVVYSRRLANNLGKIGMRFLSLENEVYDVLVQFVRSLLGSKSGT